MHPREPSIFKACSNPSEQTQVLSTQPSYENQYQHPSHYSCGLVQLEKECKVLSLRRINCKETDPAKRLENKINRMEGKMEKFEKFYARKSNKLKKKLLQEDHKQAMLEQQINLLKLELASNIKKIGELAQLVQECETKQKSATKRVRPAPMHRKIRLKGFNFRRECSPRGCDKMI